MMHSKLICSGICLAAVFLAATLARAQSPSSAAEDKNKPVQNKRELSLQSNDDLLKQANAIHDKALSDYLAQLRILATAEAQLGSRVQADRRGASGRGHRRARYGTKAGREIRRKGGRIGTGSTTGRAPRPQAHGGAEGSAGTHRQHHRRLPVRRRRLSERARRLASLRPGGQAALQDRSLAGNLVPDSIKEEYLYKMRGRLRDDLVALKRKADDTQRGQENIRVFWTRRPRPRYACDPCRRGYQEPGTSDAATRSGKSLHGQEGRRSWPPRLERMVEEGIGLKGTYQLALHKIDGHEGRGPSAPRFRGRKSRRRSRSRDSIAPKTWKRRRSPSAD